jgi:hypothetical protein
MYSINPKILKEGKKLNIKDALEPQELFQYSELLRKGMSELIKVNSDDNVTIREKQKLEP